MAEIVDDTFTFRVEIIKPLPKAQIVSVRVAGQVMTQGGTYTGKVGQTYTIEVVVKNVGDAGTIFCKVLEETGALFPPTVQIDKKEAYITAGGTNTFRFSLTPQEAFSKNYRIEVGHYE